MIKELIAEIINGDHDIVTSFHMDRNKYRLKINDHSRALHLPICRITGGLQQLRLQKRLCPACK